jgi:hypothetical protein
MYLNDPNHLQVQDIDSLEANELVMAFIHDNMIEPMTDNNMLDNDQLSMLNVIGGALKAIAQKAHAYETLTESQDSSHYRN